MRFSTLTSAAALFELSIAGYVLQDDYMTDFYSNFDFFTGPDPTEGFVQFVDEATGRETGLINSTGVSWGVDTTNQTPDGRPSIRIESKKSYDSGLIVLDVAHMPFGCGTWPAFWTIGPNWPKNGEIDIIEGVNEQDTNGMTLHTGPGCQIGQDTTQFAGDVITGNCDIAAENQGKNVGCSIENPSSKSYGAGLNAIGGGVYATQWTPEAISVYFFPRDSVPADVLGDNPDPTGWGKPAAKFASGGCDIENTFKQQKMVFDTTFCGQWAGSSSVWDNGSCGKKAATCEEWVQNNPEAFAEAYWEVNALKVYQDNGDASAPAASSTPAQSSATSVVVPVPTSNGSLSTTVPAVSSALVAPTDLPAVPTSLIIPSASGIFAPIPTSETLSAVPTASISPLPVNQVSSGAPSAAPSATQTQDAASPVAPTSVAPIATAGGMADGFNWPTGDAGDNDDTAPTTTAAASPVQSTGVPAQGTSGAVAGPSSGAAAAPTSGAAAVPSPVQNIAQPSSAPVASQVPLDSSVAAPAPTDAAPAPTDAAPAAPVVTNTVEAVRTVYETVYATVTAGAEATPAPAARKARMARHIREHRQRLTKHHARR